jgi:hypothetical protein
MIPGPFQYGFQALKFIIPCLPETRGRTSGIGAAMIGWYGCAMRG